MGRRKPDIGNVRIESIIGQGIILDGNVKAEEPVRIDGEIHGDVVSSGLVLIGKTGKIKGSIEAENIIVGGTVDGDLTSFGRIEIVEGGNVGGNIKTKSLIIDENALFQGQCTMFKEEDMPARDEQESSY